MSFKCTCTQRLSCAPPICVRSHFCHHISLVDEHKQKDKMRYIHDYYIHVYNNIYFVICVCAIQSTVFRNLVSDITIEDFFGFDFGNPSHFFCIIIIIIIWLKTAIFPSATMLLQR